MTTKRLYHRDIYLPPEVKNLPETRIGIGRVLPHAISESQLDRYGEIDIPEEIYFSGSEIVELGVEEDGLKYVVRLPYSRNLDVTYVIKVYNNGWTELRTMWLNDMFDDHKTLDESKYYCPFPF